MKACNFVCTSVYIIVDLSANRVLWETNIVGLNNRLPS